MLSILSLPQVAGSYKFNADLSRMNWFKVGGKAEVLFTPKDVGDLINFLKGKDPKIPINVFGVGSNIIIRDKGVKGVVIKLGEGFAKIFYEEDSITIGGNVLCYNAVLYTKTHGLSGLEFLAGIPGSISGAIVTKAGCHNVDISSVLISASAVDFNGNVIHFEKEDLAAFYQNKDPLAKNIIFVDATFKIEKTTQEEVSKNISMFNHKREKLQETSIKAGGAEIFKNPQGNKKAWQLIEESGCRGMELGRAKISEKYCNFIISKSGAKAQDIIDLGNKVIEIVKAKTGVTLQWKIKIIGEE